MIKAVIFDMDGTMIDTEGLWGDVNTRLAAKYNVVFTEDLRTQMMGRKNFDSLSIFKEYFKLSVPVEDLIALRNKMILEDLSLIKVKDGLYELLDMLEKLSIKKAVATSSFPEFIDSVLPKFNLKERFEVIVDGDEVAVSKPHPEIFLMAAKRLGVNPSECLVLEDAQNGIEAAHNAHMKSIAIPHKHSNHHDFSKATIVINSLKLITAEFLQNL